MLRRRSFFECECQRHVVKYITNTPPSINSIWIKNQAGDNLLYPLGEDLKTKPPNSTITIAKALVGVKH